AGAAPGGGGRAGGSGGCCRRRRDRRPRGADGGSAGAHGHREAPGEVARGGPRGDAAQGGAADPGDRRQPLRGGAAGGGAMTRVGDTSDPRPVGGAGRRAAEEPPQEGEFDRVLEERTEGVTEEATAPAAARQRRPLQAGG